MNMDQFLGEAIPLIAEDLRDARKRLGLTSARAAKRAGISASRYRMLESDRLRKTKYNITAMISVAKCLGLESVRVSYVDFIDQYMRVDVTGNSSERILIDTLDSSVAQLKEQGCFISPYRLLDFVDREGVDPILDSRDRVDKMIVELWVTAIFTLCLDDDLDYYVRVSKDDPPDTEVLRVDKKTNDLSVMSVEITQYGRYSTSVTDVIGKKLMKRYQDGTTLIVFVEESQKLSAADLYDFIWKNNPHKQKVFFIGFAGEIGKFKAAQLDEVTAPTADGKVWLARTVDINDNSKRRCEYDGVVVKVPYMSSFPRVLPTFIRKVELHR